MARAIRLHTTLGLAAGWAMVAACGESMEGVPTELPPVRPEIRSLTVPVDPAGGSAAELSLRYAWLDRTDVANPPVLVFQFGGPGSSAVALLDFVSTTLPRWVTRRYALVGLDELSAGASRPISCPDLGASDDEAYPHPFRASSVEALIDIWEPSTTSCRDGYPFAGRIGTESHARDLERLRVELGVPDLSFYTYSYGTRVALTYAALFPDRVGRLVLDSPVDPRARFIDQLREQALSREAVLERFFVWCARQQDCDVSRDGVYTAITRLEALPAGAGLVFQTVINSLVFELQWPAVAADLAVIAHNPDVLANESASLRAPPSFFATICSDTAPYDRTDIEREVAELSDARVSDIPRTFFADAFNGAYACLYWPPAAASIDWPATLARDDLAARTLIVNATGDLLSPPSMADALAAAMPDVTRVVADEVSHSVGLQGLNGCVDGAIRAFLTDDGGDLAGTRTCPPSTF